MSVSEAKKILLRRCVLAVGVSLIVQSFLLVLYLLCEKFCLCSLKKWMARTFFELFHWSTWTSIVPLFMAQLVCGMLMARCYMAPRRYYTCRFLYMFRTFIIKLALLCMHVALSVLTVWLYANHLHLDYRHFITSCYGLECINARYFFLSCVGVTAGCYHYAQLFLGSGDPSVKFPKVYEPRWTKIRSLIYINIYQAMWQSFRPTLGIIVLYCLLGGIIQRQFSLLYSMENIDDSLSSLGMVLGNVRLLFYAWMLFALILFNMRLLQNLITLYLVEPFDFPVKRETEKTVTLSDALCMDLEPVIQSLAARHFYYMSQSKDPSKRREIFALSSLGGHPYMWEDLSTKALSLISIFAQNLNVSYDEIARVKNLDSPLNNIHPSESERLTAQEFAEKILVRQYNRTHGIRHLVPERNVRAPKRYKRGSDLKNMWTEFRKSAYTLCSNISWLAYIFCEPEGGKTTFLLSHSQVVIWLCEALAAFCAASLDEDKYGVVQPKLPEIIHVLMRLKAVLDKLTNVYLNGMKCDKNWFAMKTAVRRSLYRICTAFADYLNDIVDDPDELRELLSFVEYQET